MTLSSYTRISEVAIAKQAVELSDALSYLEKGESVELIGDNEE